MIHFPHLSTPIHTFTTPAEEHPSALHTTPVIGVWGVVGCVFETSEPHFHTTPVPHLRAIMSNLKPADELLTIRQKIKDLTAREEALKAQMMAEGADLSGNFAVAFLTKRATSRFDRKAAEAELGSLARFDVKGETVALMVKELAQVVE